MFPLLVVVGDNAGGLSQADGHLTVVGDPIAGALVVLVEAQASLPQHTVHVLPGSAHTHTHTHTDVRCQC